VREMKVGPSEPPCGGGFKPPCAALAEDRRRERHGKGAHDASGGDQEDGAQLRGDPGSLLKCRNSLDDIKTGTRQGCPGISPAVTRLLAGWCPACRRREPGLLLSYGTWEGVLRY
jgi:hypothetical protein